MARCSNPRTIRNPSSRLFPVPAVAGPVGLYARDNLRRHAYDEIVVPCGKCLACLKNKQSSMSVRCKREAELKGSFAFMTLTYDDDHLPLAMSLWCADRDTGEFYMLEKPEFVSTGIHPSEQYCNLFKTLVPSSSPRYHEFPLNIPDGSLEYYVRITPSVCRSDIQDWLKMARIQYERDKGEKLPEFSYVAISEYGPRTCRPHYHLAFFGLQRPHLNYLLDRWTYGKVKQVKMVSQINSDRSNGFVRAARYIGKYMSKGKFECDSVKDCSAQRPRVCQSKHLGTKELEPIKRQVFCFDLFGEYDAETLRFPDGKPLTRLQVDALVREIPRRLVYHIGDGEKDYVPLPRIIRDKIFKTIPKDDEQAKRKAHGKPFESVSSALWCMVTAAIRDESVSRGQQKFAEFCAIHPEREISENCLEFAYWEDFCSEVQESSLSAHFQDFYAKSHF